MKNIASLILCWLFYNSGVYAQSPVWHKIIDTDRTDILSPSICLDPDNKIFVSTIREQSTGSGDLNNLISVQILDGDGTEIYNTQYAPYPHPSAENYSITNLNSKVDEGLLFHKGHYRSPDSSYFFFSLLDYLNDSVTLHKMTIKDEERVKYCDFNNEYVEILISNIFNNTLIYKIYNRDLNLVDQRFLNIDNFNKQIYAYNNNLYLITDSISSSNFISYKIQKYNFSGLEVATNILEDVMETQNLPNNFNIQDINIFDGRLIVKARNIHKNNNPLINGLESNLFFVVIDTSNLEIIHTYSINEINANAPVGVTDNGQAYSYADNKLVATCKNITDNNVPRIVSYYYQDGILLFKRELFDSSISNINMVAAQKVIITENSVLNLYNLPSYKYLIQVLDLRGNTLLSYHNKIDSTANTGGILDFVREEDQNSYYLFGSLNYTGNTDNDLFLTKIKDLHSSVNRQTMDRIYLYPNPTENLIYIDNLNGILVGVYDLFYNSVGFTYANDVIDIKSLPKGVYIAIFQKKSGERIFARIVKR